MNTQYDRHKHTNQTKPNQKKKKTICKFWIKLVRYKEIGKSSITTWMWVRREWIRLQQYMCVIFHSIVNWDKKLILFHSKRLFKTQTTKTLDEKKKDIEKKTYKCIHTHAWSTNIDFGSKIWVARTIAN